MTDDRRDQADEPTKEQQMTDQTAPIVDEEGPATTSAPAPAPAGGVNADPDPVPDLVPGLAARSGDTGPAQPVAGAPGGPSASAAPQPAEARRRGPSVPTIVLGLLFGLVAVVVMVGQTTEVDLNLEVSAPLTLLVAGVVLVVWGVAGLGRSRRTP